MGSWMVGAEAGGGGAGEGLRCLSGLVPQRFVEQFLSVVDVPVIFKDKFQQSKRFELKVPQTQFFLRVPDIPVPTQRQVPTVLTLTVQVQFLEGLTPVVVQRQVFVVTVQKTVEVPQLQVIDVGVVQFLDKVVEVPVAVHVRRSSSSWTWLLTCPLLCTSGAGRDSAENCGGSAVAVHPQGGGSDVDKLPLMAF